MTSAASNRQRKLATIGVVVAVHAVVLWLVRGGLDKRPVDEVVAVQLVSQFVVPQAVQAAKPIASPAKSQAAAAVPAVMPLTKAPIQQPSKPLSPAPVMTSEAPSALTAAAALPAAPSLNVPAAQTGAATNAPSGSANSANSSNSTGAGSAASASNGPGGGSAAARVELPSSDADYLHNPKPEYPRMSRQRNEQGKVVVNVFIGVDGLAQKAELKSSSGFERLDQAALATAKAWRYVPGKRGGVPEAMWFAVPINFVMD